MIGRLSGKLVAKEPPMVTVDVAGVGYDCMVSMHTFERIGDMGETVVLFTHLIWREDNISLYGFASEAERQVFRDLLKVSGVGAKVALSILSHLSVQDIVNAIQNNQVDILVRVPGIGKKTAERMMLDLRDRLSHNLHFEHATRVHPEAKAATSSSAEAVAALVNLGYKAADANRIVAKFDSTSSTAELIRQALKEFAQ